ncbi:hypothetical protein I3760_15G031700 [Carya illinoinensis]|nr:hypothetical protein I3760_15G031700 [Carya illinoinensis]
MVDVFPPQHFLHSLTEYKLYCCLSRCSLSLLLPSLPLSLHSLSTSSSFLLLFFSSFSSSSISLVSSSFYSSSFFFSSFSSSSLVTSFSPAQHRDSFSPELSFNNTVGKIHDSFAPRRLQVGMQRKPMKLI